MSRNAGPALGADRVGGPRTIQAFRELGALDVLELLKIPFLLGDGVALVAPGTPEVPLKLERQQTHPDGTLQLTYTCTDSRCVGSAR